MKLLKKLALLLLTACVCLGIGLMTGCEDDPAGSSEELTDYVYKVRVQSEGGFGLKNVVVGLYDNNGDLVKEKTTSAQGNAYFTEDDGVNLGVYEVRLSDVPAGWSQDSSITYKTSKTNKSDLTVAMSAELITDETIPSTKKYQLGDVMYDFTVKTSDGKSVNLASVLEEKKMVLLNFWATWCGPCKSEFPAMQNAYIDVGSNGNAIKEDVAILAISTTDTQSAVAEFKSKNGLTFDMAGETNLPTRFGVSSVPVSIVIDRYGVISYWHVGSMTAKSDFIGLFDKFTGENYVQTVISEGEYEGSNSSGTEETEMVKPNVSAPSTSDVNKILNADGGFSSSWDDGEYSWPFTIEEADGKKYLRAANADVHNSYSILSVDFEAKAGDILYFDALISTELDADYLYVLMDGTLIHQISGAIDKWKTYCAYVFTSEEAGKHTLSFSYVKDSSLSGGEDEVWLRDLRIVSTSDKAAIDADIVSKLGTATSETDPTLLGGVDIFRNAATKYNEVPEDNDGKAEKKAQYQNYVTVKFNTQDGYYHVGTEDGPLLFANIMSPSLWNEYDLWQLAYNDLLIYNGMNLSDAVEDYAWAATNSDNEYVPVTKDLRHLLDLIVKIEDSEGAKADPDYHKAYHENEWLELCVYFDHYGNTPQMSDPTAGITYDGAIEITEGENHIVCDVALVPLGVKHKFIPDESGVYHVYSIVPVEYEGTMSSTDPQCWIVAPDRETFLAYGENNMLADENTNYDNFDIYIYLEKDSTYYMLFAFFLNDIGSFDMRIDKVDVDGVEGIDQEYVQLTNAAEGTYSYNEVTSETYVPTAIEWAYDEDKYVRAVNADGSLGSYIYLDMTRATYLFPSTSFELIIEEAENRYSKDVTKRAFYLDGVDYTPLLKKYLFRAKLNQEQTGMVKIDETLLNILLKITETYDGFGGVENSWQLMCYYERTISKDAE